MAKQDYWTLGSAVCEHVGLDPRDVRTLRMEFLADGTARLEVVMFEPRPLGGAADLPGASYIKRYRLGEGIGGG